MIPEETDGLSYTYTNQHEYEREAYLANTNKLPFSRVPQTTCSSPVKYVYNYVCVDIPTDREPPKASGIAHLRLIHNNSLLTLYNL